MKKICSIVDCNEIALRIYPLFNNKPYLIRLALCKQHSKEANESLKNRKLKNLSKKIKESLK